MSRATIKDVAKAANVSIATVSHVINETRYVEDETKQRVLLALKQLDYRPNIVARSMRNGKTCTIGLVVPDVSNLFFSEIARRIENYGFEKGYSVILCNSDNNLKKESQYFDILLAKSVDGVIFMPTGNEINSFDDYILKNIPIVVADRNYYGDTVDTVMIDNEYGGWLATNHLIECGCKKIACITGPDFVESGIQRVEGYQRALHEAGIAEVPSLIVHGDFSMQSGYKAMDALITAGKEIDSVFVLNDMMAIGAMACIRAHGRSIPEDIAVIGFDNIELAASMYPSLSTIAQPMEEIAASLVNILLERKKYPNLSTKRMVFHPSLIVRNTTKKE